MQQIIPISELTMILKGVVESEDALQDVWVDGEISNLTIARSGHAYFTLKDDQSQLDAVIWKNVLSRQRVVPKHGDRVIAHGGVTVYHPRGSVQLQVDVLQPQGEGLLQAKLEQLRQKLDAEGLFDESRKRPLPAFPARIGVVTSATGAVWHDIQTVIARRYPMAELILSPTIVQGPLAPDAIVAALETLQEDETPDVIIVGRGGGSLEDLWAFNDERVVRAIFGSRVPIISAVGHETDTTLADYAADRRAPTPSAAAELAVPDLGQLDLALAELQIRIHDLIDDHLAYLGQRIDDAQERLVRVSPTAGLQQVERELDGLASRARSALHAGIRMAQRDVDALERTLRALDPHSLLSRGFAWVEREDSGAAVRSIGDVTPGTTIRATLADGRITADVTDISS